MRNQKQITINYRKLNSNGITKIILVGNANVGKSSLALALSNNHPNEEQKLATSANFQTKAITIGNWKWKFFFLDPGNSEHHFCIPNTVFYKDIDIVMILYAIDNRQSFESTTHWFQLLEKLKLQPAFVIIVGTKKDLSNTQREVFANEGQQLAKKWNALFVETSYKTREGLFELFNMITTSLFSVTCETK